MANGYWILKDDKGHFYWRIATTPEEAADAWREVSAAAPSTHWRSIWVVESEPAPVAAAPEERIDILARVLGQANGRIDELAKRLDDSVARLKDVDIRLYQDGESVNRQLDMLAKALDLAIDRVAKLENPDITGKGLLGVLDAHNERIGKLEKLTEEIDTKERQTFDYAVTVNKTLLARIKALEAHKPESVLQPAQTQRMVVAAFDEPWAPNLAMLLPDINWVGVSQNGMMSGAEKDFEIEDRHWTGSGETQTLGYVGHLNIDWRTSKRKVIR